MMENIQETPSEQGANDSRDTGMPMWVQGVGLIITLVAVIYCISTRSWEAVIKYTLYVSSGLFIVFLLIVALNIYSHGITKSGLKSFASVFLFILIALLFGGLANYSVFAGIKDIFFWFRSPSFSKTSALILTPLLTLILGSGLFYFRLRARAIYGMTEAAIGLVVAGNRVLTQMDGFASSDFYLAILTASVYLIVRGFDNIHQGLSKDPIDPFGRKLFSFLNKRVQM